MFKHSKLALATLVAISSSAAMAQQAASAQAPQQLDRVEVTGSAIKRLAGEQPAPIEVVTRKDIARIGATSINELMKSIPALDISDAGEISSNSPGGSGTARARLRGLGDGQTLVLVNGRRVPVNPLADASGAGAAFNINQIPIQAIDRIEILKDGGSAIYGADAVAGVVNFILRKDYQGAIVTVQYGQSSRGDGEEKSASATGGYGDLNRDGFNVLASIDVFQREKILRKDRDISKTVDFRRFGPIPGFNLDGRSGFAPEGNILAPNGAFAGTQVRPCAPANLNPVNNTCRYDFNASLLSAYNGADRVSGLLNGTMLLGKDFTAYARLMGSEQKDNFEAHPVPDNFRLPDGRFYAGRFMQGGPRITDKTTTFYNVDVGVDGVIGNFDVKVAASSGKSESTNADRNYYDRAAYDNATRNNLIDPTVLTNDPAVIAGLKVSPVRKGSAKQDSVDAMVSGDAFKLLGEQARFATGLSWWKETLVDAPDARQIAGTVVGSIQQSAVSADLAAKAAFIELSVPFTKAVEVQLATRYDKYDGSKGNVSSKVGAKWTVIPEFALRASYSESFKAPTLKQLFANAGQGAINLTEDQCRALGFPAGCAGQPAFRITGSNPDLKPEQGKSYNLGFIAEKGAFSVAVDAWQIDKSDNISTPTLLSAIEQGFTRFDTTTARWFIFQNLQNFAQSRTAGVDLDSRVRFRGTPVGDVTVRAAGTYYSKQQSRTTSSSPWAEFNETYNTPRWRNIVSASTEMGPWAASAAYRTTSGFYDTTFAKQNFGLLPAGGLRKVGAYSELDVGINWRGVKNLDLSFQVKNLLDAEPPFSATNATNNNFSQQGFAELYNSRGRFFQVGMTYRFQ